MPSDTATTLGRSGKKKPRRPVTEKQRAANKLNAQRPRPGGRAIRGPEGEVLKAALAEARNYTLEAVRGLIELCGSRDEQVRLRAFAELLDRGGVVKGSESSVTLSAIVGTPKLVKLEGSAFAPPPEWNEPLQLAATPAQLEAPARASLPQTAADASVDVSATPKSGARVESAHGQPDANEAQHNSELRSEDEERRQHERDRRFLEEMTADDDTTAHQMFRALRGWR